MESNVDRYAEVLKDLLIIANARVEVKAATNRIKQRLTVHEVSDKPRCDPTTATMALRKLINDDLIGELVIHRPAGNSRDVIKYKSFTEISSHEGRVTENGCLFMAQMIGRVGVKTIMEGVL